MRHLAALCLTLALSVLSAGAATPEGRRLGVGLYGSNGHQLSPAFLATHPHARLVAVAGLRANPPASSGAKVYADLAALLADPAVEIVSLCSPRRADQAREAIRCLAAGKHVYAEKPCALTEPELDDVLAAAQRHGREFHEMAGTAWVQPYFEMRRLVREGAVGDVIQVLVQKSYPYGAQRPQDEAIDGGLFLQAGIHAIRLVEHAAGARIRSVQGWETKLGNPEGGECRIAGAVQLGLEGGGLATIIMNYLNAVNFKPRNNETLRIFGTRGFIESVDDGTTQRRVSLTGQVTPLATATPAPDYFTLLSAHLTTGSALPQTSEEELRPLRWLLRAKAALRTETVTSPARLERAAPAAK